MLTEIRFALRTLRKNPGFTLTAVATLALAIGVNTTMFSVLNAVLLRPLPVRSPEQLMMLWTELPNQSLRQGRSAYVNVEEWRRQSRSFEDMAVLDPVSAMLASAEGTQQVSVARMSPNFFPLLGVQPALGRTFTEQEANERQRVAVISHRFWQTHLGGSAQAIGASIELDGQLSRVIGVLPAEFSTGFGEDIWEPHTLFPDWETRRSVRGADSWFVFARLRPGVTIDQAQAEMKAIARGVDEQLPSADRNRGVSIVPLGEHIVGSSSRLALWMLTGAVFCVLLIAAANVASLSLARSVGRTREMAIRSALGASAGRIFRQLIAESLTLATIAGVLGTLLAYGGVQLVRAFGPAGLPRGLDSVGLDARVLTWALALSFLTGILVGLAPALTMLRQNLRPAVEEGGKGVAGGVAARGLRRALVVVEFALAIVLLAGAGLLVRSWWQVERVDPGFARDRVLMLSIMTLRPQAQWADFHARVLEEVEAAPGVESAGLIGDLFIGGNSEQVLTTEGDTGISTGRLRFRRDEVSARFFATVGASLLRGRFFTAADGPDAPRVAIVNEAMARRLWAGRDPIGQRFTLGAGGAQNPDAQWFTVVGVVSDMRRQGLESDPIPQMFEPVAQNPSRREVLLVRTSSADPLTMAATLRAAVGRVDPRAIYGITTLDDRLGSFLTQRRFETSLLIAFSAVALLMAAIGIYGLIQYSVATRTHEIGIRMAIGASAADIFRMTIREGLQLSLTGLAIGLFGALWVGRAGASLLFGVSATDPVTFISVSLLLTAVAVAACYFPARRAMKVEPIMALRQE